MSGLRWLSAALLALALVAGAVLLLQRQSAAQLREEAALLREEHRGIARLRAENQRLVAAQMPEAELERLRSDHAAVARLRGEIEKVKDDLQAQERALAQQATTKPTVPPPSAAPALALNIGIGTDGNLSLDGSPVVADLLQQRLAGLPRGSLFEIRLQTPKGENAANFENVKRGVEGIAAMAKDMAKERGLRMTLKLETSGKE